MTRHVWTVTALTAILTLLEPVRALLALGPATIGHPVLGAAMFRSPLVAFGMVIATGAVIASNAERLFDRP